MQKILLIAASLVLAFASACVKPTGNIDEHSASLTDSAQLTDVSTVSDSNYSEMHNVPPPEIVFFSMGQFRDFAASIELDDIEFQKFLDSHSSYGPNGVKTKSDAINVLNTLGSIPMPEVEAFPLKYVSLRFDLDRVYVLYKDDQHALGFDITITPGEETAEDKAGSLIDEAVIMDSSDLPELKYLVWVKDVRGSDGRSSYYFTNIRSHSVRLITTMPEEAFLNALRGCRYTTISEYAEKYS